MSASNRAWQQSLEELTLVTYTMLVPNSAVTMPGKVTIYEEFITWGLSCLSLPQSYLLTPEAEQNYNNALAWRNHMKRVYICVPVAYKIAHITSLRLHLVRFYIKIYSTSYCVFVWLCKNNLLDWRATGDRIQPWTSVQKLQMTFQEKWWRRDL